MKIEVLVENAGSNFSASSDDPCLHGVVAAAGKTRAVALSDFRSALQFHIDGLREDGYSVPEITEFEIREIAAGSGIVDRAAAVPRLRELAKGVSLGGESVKAMIADGRKY